MSRSIQACIFDMDGVIVDTAEAHYQSWCQIAAEWGFEFSRIDNEPLKGASRMHSLEMLLELAGMQKTQSEKEAICTIKNSYYLQSIAELDTQDVLPGVLDLLQELNEQSISIALGSASRNAKHILELLGLSTYFQAQVDGNDLTRGKPDPEVFLRASDLLGIAPEACLVIEDAAKGIQAAHLAGMMAVGIGDAEALHEANVVLPSLAGMSWAQILAKVDQGRTETVG